MYSLSLQLEIGNLPYGLKEAWDIDLGNPVQETNCQQLWKPGVFISNYLNDWSSPYLMATNSIIYLCLM